MAEEFKAVEFIEEGGQLGEDGREGSSPGARTIHLPSVCVSATRETLRFHCSLIERSF